MADMNVDPPTPDGGTRTIDDMITVEQHATVDLIVNGLLKPNGFGLWRKFNYDRQLLTIGAGKGPGIVINAWGEVIPHD